MSSRFENNSVPFEDGPKKNTFGVDKTDPANFEISKEHVFKKLDKIDEIVEQMMTGMDVWRSLKDQYTEAQKKASIYAKLFEDQVNQIKAEYSQAPKDDTEKQRFQFLMELADEYEKRCDRYMTLSDALGEQLDGFPALQDKLQREVDKTTVEMEGGIPGTN